MEPAAIERAPVENEPRQSEPKELGSTFPPVVELAPEPVIPGQRPSAQPSTGLPPRNRIPPPRERLPKNVVPPSRASR